MKLEQMSRLLDLDQGSKLQDLLGYAAMFATLNLRALAVATLATLLLIGGIRRLSQSAELRCRLGALPRWDPVCGLRHRLSLCSVASAAADAPLF